MPRFPRLQYENAVYHIVTRGDGRRRLFHDARHYEQFTQGLVDEVDPKMDRLNSVGSVV